MQMVSDYIDGIRTVQPSDPYYLLGECIGGMIALEMAQQLRASGQHLARLILLDTQRRFGMMHGVTRKPRRVASTFLHSYKTAYLQSRLRHHWQTARQLEGTEQIRYFLGKAVKSRAALKEQIDAIPGDVRDMAGTAFSHAIRCYLRQPYPDPVTLLANEQWAAAVPRLGWEAQTLPNIQTVIVPGTHATNLREKLANSAHLVRRQINAVFQIVR